MRLNDVTWLALMAALGLSACTTSTAAAPKQASDPEEAAEQAADAQAEADLREHHRARHRGGVMQFVAMGLDTVGPSDAARPEIERIQEGLYGCMAPAAEVTRQLRLTIAEGVAAGAVDLAKVDGLLRQLDGTAEAVRSCSVAALDQLHRVLSAVERAELVEKVQANLEVWQQVNSDEDLADRGPGGRLGRLAKEVSLTPEQVERASASLHTALSGRSDRLDRAKLDADVRDFADAFEGATFEASSTARYANPRLASHGATRMAIFYETVTPLLTPGQRAVLAEHLRARAGPNPAISAN